MPSPAETCLINGPRVALENARWANLAHHIETGRGFALVRGLPVEAWGEGPAICNSISIYKALRDAGRTDLIGRLYPG